VNDRPGSSQQTSKTTTQKWPALRPVHFEARIATFVAVVLMDDDRNGVHEGVETARRRRLRSNLPIVADRRGPDGGSILDQEAAIAPELIVRNFNL
jgi:hypothetical protein